MWHPSCPERNQSRPIDRLVGMSCVVAVLLTIGCGQSRSVGPTVLAAKQLIGRPAVAIKQQLGEPEDIKSTDWATPQFTSDEEYRKWNSTTVGATYIYPACEIDVNMDGIVVAVRERR
jgi:hypothetical protein